MPVPYADCNFAPFDIIPRREGRVPRPLVFDGVRAQLNATSVFQSSYFDPASAGPLHIGVGKTTTERRENRETLYKTLNDALLNPASLPILLPEGVLELDSPYDGHPMLEVTKTAVLLGSRNSELRFGPDTISNYNSGPTFDAFCVADATWLRIEGVRLTTNFTGPAPYKINSNGDREYKTVRCITHNDGTGDVQLIGVRIDGWFTQAIVIKGRSFAQGATPGAGGTLEVIGSSITSFGNPIASSSVDPIGKSIRMRDTSLSLTLPAWPMPTGPPHLMYLSPAVSIDMDRCEIGGSALSTGKAGYGVHHFTGGDTTAQTGAAYARFNRCSFTNAEVGLLTSDGDETVEVIGCRFHDLDNAIQLRNDALIADCRFERVASGVTAGHGDPANRRVWIRACRFEVTDVAVSTGSKMRGSHYLVELCDVVKLPLPLGNLGSAPIEHHFLNANDDRQSTLHIRDCRISSGVTGPGITAGKHLIVERTRLIGEGGGGITVNDKNDHYPYLTTIIDSDMTGLVGYHAFNAQNAFNPLDAAMQEVFLDGSGNKFGSQAIRLNDDPKHQGAMHARSGMQASVVLIDVYGAANLNFNFDEYVIVGGGKDLKHIWVGGSDGVAAFGGRMILHNQDGFGILPKAGNVASVFNETPAAGTIHHFVRDATGRMWHEVHP